jgi:hypothetical protein
MVVPSRLMHLVLAVHDWWAAAGSFQENGSLLELQKQL